MRIVIASSEAVPFSKTGGLADVTSALAKALDSAGHSVVLILPYSPQVQAKRGLGEFPLHALDITIEIPIASRKVVGRLLQCSFPDSNVIVYLVDQPEYFDRGELYQEEGVDYEDNCERFVFFSRAVMETIRTLDLKADVIHANDWQTGLVPALLDIEYRHVPEFEQTGCVFTIHNMAFQGHFWRWDMLLTGFDWKYFNWRQMEFFENLNLLKTGIAFSDLVTTVSPTYACEIRTAEFGCGLEGVLAERSEDLVGILNGVDTAIWNPETDPALPKNYDSKTVSEGKAVCKTELQQQLGLPERGDVPLFGMISRMTDQKGFDLIADSANELLEFDLQLCFLGTGDREYEQLIEQLAKQHPDKVAAVIGFDEDLAHRIEAGSDIFLMPSRYEPCGLNQMYSLLYGTVPVVRSVGGLADSVVHTTEHTLADGTATGFCFEDYSGEAFTVQIRYAIELFGDTKTWNQLVQTGMNQDWSWNRSASEYERIYQRAMAKRNRTQVCSTSSQ